MRRRANPWPSFVDFFSALLVFALGALLLFRDDVEPIRVLVGEIRDSVVARIQVSLPNAQARQCGLDACIDVPIHFSLNSDVIDDPQERLALETACSGLKVGLDALSAEHLRAVRLVIEGHADRQIRPRLDSIGRTLINWQVSAQRSARVLFELSRCGLRAPAYPLMSAAYGDTDPLCLEDSEECYLRNRRVTLRLQVDSRRLEPDTASVVAPTR